MRAMRARVSAARNDEREMMSDRQSLEIETGVIVLGVAYAALLVGLMFWIA